MTVLVFTNPGEIDIRAVTVFGVSVKNTRTPIGQFGTGLKFAIAAILRLGGKITIYSGESRYLVGYIPQLIRGQPFNLVTMAGVSTDFTTDLGKHWEPWQAYRELFCNVLDEGGELQKVSDDSIWFGSPGETRIYVKCDELSALCHDDYFVTGNPIVVSESVGFHPKSAFIAGFRGVRVLSTIGPVTSALYTYDLLGEIDLTEDRTLRSQTDATSKIVAAMLALTNVDILTNIFENGDEFEKFLDFNRYDINPSKAFVRTAFAVAVDQRKGWLNGSLKALCRRANPARMQEIDDAVPDTIDAMFEGAPARVDIPSDPGVWGYISDLEINLTNERNRADYWERCARKLAGEQDPAPLAPLAPIPTDEIPF